MITTEELSLTLIESAEIEDGYACIDASDMRMLAVSTGDVVPIEGNRRTYLQLLPASLEDRNQRIVKVSPLSAKNLGLLTGQKVRVFAERAKPPVAELVIIQAEDDIDQLHVMARQKQIGSAWNKRVVVVDDEIKLPTLDRYPLLVKVLNVQPAGAVQLSRATEFVVASAKTDLSIQKIGGLRETYRTCQSLIQKRFAKGMALATRSIFLTGPSGIGKARLVSRLAQENNIEFLALDVYHLLDKGMEQGGVDLSGILGDLGRKGRSILLINNLDAIANNYSGDPLLARAAYNVVSQLCALLDELPTQPNVVVFGVSALPLDPRLLENKRFDIHIPVEPPTRWGRHEILLLATEKMALGSDVDLASLAQISAGMTAQDLSAVAKSAETMACGPKVGERDFLLAFRSTGRSAQTEILCDIPTAVWDEVAGLDDIKQLVFETVSWSLHQYDKFAVSGVKPPRSILLSGGQGTGKTSLVRALAAHMPIQLIDIPCPILVARHQQDSARFLREAFDLARRKAPCVLFLDDIDALFDIAPVSAEPGSYQHPVVSQLLAELDTLSPLVRVIVIAATNRPDRLSSDVLRPGRFDYAVTLPLPDLAARRKVLQIHARKLPLAADIDFERLAASMQGMSSAEIANICNRVGLMAVRQSLSTFEGGGGMPVVSAELFDQALRGRKG